jgi:hypothetical protein
LAFAFQAVVFARRSTRSAHCAYLAEAGLLSAVTDISAVSGGSLAADRDNLDRRDRRRTHDMGSCRSRRRRPPGHDPRRLILASLILTTMPEAFHHPAHGYVGLHIVHRRL